MTTDEKLAAILAAIQTDPGNRGLAELFAYCPGDFAAACRSIAEHPAPSLDVMTGFLIPSVDPPRFETDGPLGALFLLAALHKLRIPIGLNADEGCLAAMAGGMKAAISGTIYSTAYKWRKRKLACSLSAVERWPGAKSTHHVIVECAGRSADGNCYSMRGRQIPSTTNLGQWWVNRAARNTAKRRSIGIGDGGNEIGMGKIPHEIVAKNIPNGDLIHCRVPTDHLIVAGVSNWGAYALAAGVYVLRGAKPQADLFDPDREREILEVMVREGPLVDGVTGKQTATVDGLSWDEYVKPLIRIREILEA